MRVSECASCRSAIEIDDERHVTPFDPEARAEVEQLRKERDEILEAIACIARTEPGKAPWGQRVQQAFVIVTALLRDCEPLCHRGHESNQTMPDCPGCRAKKLLEGKP